MKQTLQNKRGRLDSCVPTNNGHYYSSKIVVAWDPIGWSVLHRCSSTTCVSSP